MAAPRRVSTGKGDQAYTHNVPLWHLQPQKGVLDLPVWPCSCHHSQVKCPPGWPLDVPVAKALMRSQHVTDSVLGFLCRDVDMVTSVGCQRGVTLGDMQDPCGPMGAPAGATCCLAACLSPCGCL